MSPRLAFALETANVAGRRTLAYFEVVGYELKADDSPVTIADQEAERLMRHAIGKAFPGESILGEEEGGEPAPDQWVLDPIDGTKSFICGVPLYGTLISYERDGIAEVAVAHFPALGKTCWAERGLGAFCDGRPIRVSDVADMRHAVLCCGSHSSMDDRGLTSTFAALSSYAMATRTWGDAYGHCLVAMGRAEAMIDPVVKPWDLSAVNLIVEEAGGRCSDFDGKPNPRSEAISSNGRLHEMLLETLGS